MARWLPLALVCTGCMGRSGFDAFEIESEDAAQQWKIAEADMDVFYQPTGDGRPTAMRLRRK